MNANSLPSLEKTSTRLARTAAAAVALAIVFALTIVATTTARAQTFQVIHSFQWTDGANPQAGLTIDAAGNLYGTTFAGGSGRGYGSVFRLRHSGSAWILDPLYRFTGGNDGGYPFGRVALAADGTLYGTTSCGTLPACKSGVAGTVFHLTPAPTAPKTALAPWNESVLYSFTGGSDGEFPQGDLTFDQSGNIYGTTIEGGVFNCSGNRCGVVYKLTPSGAGWTETVLYAVQNNGDGAYPFDGVVFDASSNLYGVLSGSNPFGDASIGYGAVYQLSPSGSGWTEQTLHTFTGGDDGAYPIGGLIVDSFGNLYGTTAGGGSQQCGTAFDFTPDSGSWIFKTLYVFQQPYGSNGGPEAKLLMDAAGKLYGTTTGDGVYGYGSVFKLTPLNGGWTYTSLHDFTGGSDGALPQSSLVFDANGNLYGTASEGGSSITGFCDVGCGVVFEITP